MLDPDDTDVTGAASASTVAAPFAFAPDGPTQTMTGTRDRCTSRTSGCTSTSTDPPESSWSTIIVERRRLARAIASRTSDAVGGSNSPSTFTTSMPFRLGVACSGPAHATSETRIATAMATHATATTRTERRIRALLGWMAHGPGVLLLIRSRRHRDAFRPVPLPGDPRDDPGGDAGERARRHRVPTRRSHRRAARARRRERLLS